MTILTIPLESKKRTVSFFIIALLSSFFGLTVILGAFTYNHLQINKINTINLKKHKINENLEINSNNELLELKLVSGTIDYSFITSIMDLGLSKNEINALLHFLKNRFDIIKLAQNGGKFTIKYTQNLENEINIVSFYYSGGGKKFTINHNDLLVVNKKYSYQKNSDISYTPPLNKNFRISSSFSLNRKHPVTNKFTPHLGTDYAVPVGTKLFTIADGIVIKSKFDRLAGHFINIRHPNGSVSRYLHLSRRYVKVGDKVSKGDLIGLTGNSGQTTGPHLHLELHINGVPVNYEKFVKNSLRSEQILSAGLK